MHTHHHPGPGGGCGPHGQQWGDFLGGGMGSGGMTRRMLRPAVVMLLLAESPMHGYELMGKLDEFGMDHANMDPSVLYRMLRRLEREGLAESSLNDSGSGPARKVYTLTPDGREVLDLWAARIEGVMTFLSEFKSRYEKLNG